MGATLEPKSDSSKASKRSREAVREALLVLEKVLAWVCLLGCNSGAELAKEKVPRWGKEGSGLATGAWWETPMAEKLGLRLG